MFQVNRAARVEGHAAGGQVLVSRAVAEDSGLTRPAVLKKHALAVADRGDFELKGIRGTERLFQVFVAAGGAPLRARRRRRRRCRLGPGLACCGAPVSQRSSFFCADPIFFAV